MLAHLEVEVFFPSGQFPEVLFQVTSGFVAPLRFHSGRDFAPEQVCHSLQFSLMVDPFHHDLLSSV